MHHRFDKASEWVAKFEGPDRDAWQRPDVVIKAAGITTGQNVVDLGTGTGYMVPHQSKAVGATGKVEALDVEPDMVRHVTARAVRDGLGNVVARVIARDDPTLSPGTIDRVLVVDTWHHIADREAYAAKLASALRSGGAVVVVDFTQTAPMGPPVKHRLKSEQVIAELTSAGLDAEVVPADLPHQYVVVGKKAN
jgi:ubiquinone/menaquinone biosynthesis C-methylase UbiE